MKEVRYRRYEVRPMFGRRYEIEILMRLSFFLTFELARVMVGTFI